MSLCPTCQKNSSRPDFCEDCFVALGPAPSGRFQAMLRKDLSTPVALPVGPKAGPDLLTVRYQPSSWSARVLIPNAKKAALAAAVLATLGGGLLSYHHQQQKLAARSALAHLTQCNVLRTRSDLTGANVEGQLALEQAGLSGDRALLAQAQLTLGDVSAGQSLWDKAVVYYQAALDLGSDPAQLSQKLTTARQNVDKNGRAQALACLRRARQQMSARDYVPALKSTAEADRLLRLYHGSPQQLAESQYVNGLVFDRMGLTQECLEHLRLALAADPHHTQAGQLLARLTAAPPRPRPAPSSSHPSQRQTGPAEVGYPRLEVGSSYPTYQRPSKDDEEEDRLSGSDRPQSQRRSASQRAETPPPREGGAGYPTYQPRRRQRSSDLDR